MSTFAVPHRRALVLVPLLLAVLLVWWAARSGSEAATSVAPRAASSSQAGRIAFDALPGGVKATLSLRSFSAGGSNTSTPGGGGGGAGKFVADDPVAVIDAADADPLLLRVVATGVHLPKVTVTLFRPGTTARQEVWELTDVTLSALHTSQSGSAKAPRVTLGLRYAQVTMTTYGAKGAVARSFCFSVAASTVC